MKKLLVCVSLVSLFAYSEYANASDAVLSLTDGIVIGGKQSVKEDAIESLDDMVADEEELEDNENKGFFSFFSFGRRDKDSKQAIATINGKENSLENLQALADMGDVNALLNLGYMYLYGKDGVEMNYKKAFEYYQRAAMYNDDIALNNLGSIYYSGIGVRKNLSKAVELFSKASELGNIEASVNLAIIYLTKDSALNNPREAISLLKTAANEGKNATARYLLGYAYYKGLEVPQNSKKAIALISEAAKQKYDEAQYMMGYMYLYGIGVTQNYNNAIKYFTQAAKQGNLSSITELAEIYAQGKRYKKDLYQAHIFYNVASVNGVPSAAAKREAVAGKLKLEEILQAQAEAEHYKIEPSRLTSYIRNTFGYNLAHYIDDNMHQNLQR